MKKQIIQILVVLLGLLIITMGCVTTEKNIDQSQEQKINKSANVSIPRSDRIGLAVLKFENTTSLERASYFQSWEYGLAAMLSTDLVQTEVFNIVDRVRLNVIIEEQKLQTSGLVDPRTAVTIGKLIAAQYILTGTFMVVGEELKIMAQVFSVEKGILLGSSSVTGKTENFFLIEKDLFIGVTKIMRVILDEEKKYKILRTFETKSVDASLENYSGEIAMMKADEMKKLGKEKESTMFKNDAKQKFKKALRYDPEYERAKQNFANLVKAIPMTL